MTTVLSALCAIAALAACEVGPIARIDPCGGCSLPIAVGVDAGLDGDGGADAGVGADAGRQSQVCYASCDDGEDPQSCEPQARACVKTCDATTPCSDEGHPCVAYGSQTICSYECVSTACGPRRECRGLACENVQCGTIVPCLGSNDICDAIGHQCYPFDGTCTGRADCPYYDAYWDTHGTVSCTDGYCRIGVHPPELPPGLPDVATITISAPAAGQTVPDDASVMFRWTTDRSYANASTLVLVLDGYPQDKLDLVGRAVWGAALRPGVERPLTVADGRLIVDGVWTTQPGALPRDRLLTLVVQIVSDGTLLADSTAVPFAVGHAFPLRGDACDPAIGPGACASPMEAMSCHPVTETCERVCGSYRDCLDMVPARDCGAPRGNARYCE